MPNLWVIPAYFNYLIEPTICFPLPPFSSTSKMWMETKLWVRWIILISATSYFTAVLRIWSQYSCPECLTCTNLILFQGGIQNLPFLTFLRQAESKKLSTTACVWATAGNKKASEKQQQTYCACIAWLLSKCVHTFRFYAHVKISCPGCAWWVACCGKKNGLHSRNW